MSRVIHVMLILLGTASDSRYADTTDRSIILVLRDPDITDRATVLVLRDDTTESGTAPGSRDSYTTDRGTALGSRDSDTTESIAAAQGHVMLTLLTVA